MNQQTELPEDFGPPMRGRTSPLGRRPLERPGAPPGGPPDRGRQWGHGSHSRGGRGGGGTRRLLRAALVTVALVLVLALVGATGALVAISARIERQPVDNLARSRPMNVLVTGTDSREGMTREEQNELTTGSEGGNLTDTIFVLQAGGGRAAMLAFPRDLYVTRCDGSEGRINAAVQIGGPSCLVETISQVSGLDITHYLEVDFLGFRDIVDAVGGVEVCLDGPILDRESGLDLPAGCQTLDGVDGLGYVRVRKIDNDLQRIQRQQQFVKALAGEILARDTLTDPLRLWRTATSIADAVTADARLGPFDLARLSWAMRGVAGGIEGAVTVPAADATVGGASVLMVDRAAAAQVFADFAAGAYLDADEVVAVSPDEVEVRVLNAAGVAGLAGEVADELTARGFVVSEIGNATPHPSTQIRFPPGEEPAAETLRAAAPGRAELVEDPTVDAVTLELGTDLDLP